MTNGIDNHGGEHGFLSRYEFRVKCCARTLFEQLPKIRALTCNGELFNFGKCKGTGLCTEKKKSLGGVGDDEERGERGEKGGGLNATLHV